MTIPKGTYRKRRKTTLNNIPRNIKEWFSGERRFTFFAHTPPYRGHLKEYWRAWKRENPKAVMPPGLKALLSTPAYPPNYTPTRDDDMPEMSDEDGRHRDSMKTGSSTSGTMRKRESEGEEAHKGEIGAVALNFDFQEGDSNNG